MNHNNKARTYATSGGGDGGVGECVRDGYGTGPEVPDDAEAEVDRQRHRQGGQAGQGGAVGSRSHPQYGAQLEGTEAEAQARH